ncbi:MAG: hypothetical protein ACI4GC_07430 [Acutalibacteraceae bacterium]
MKQIIINYLLIFGLPLVLGFLIRMLLQRLNKSYLVTVVFAVLAVVGWLVVIVVPSHGSELNGLLSIQASVAFGSSLLAGLILRLKARFNKKDSK